MAAARVVSSTLDDEVTLVSTNSQVFRTSLKEINLQGRNTMGVIIWRPDGNDEGGVNSLLADSGEYPSAAGNGHGGQKSKNGERTKGTQAELPMPELQEEP